MVALGAGYVVVLLILFFAVAVAEDDPGPRTGFSALMAAWVLAPLLAVSVAVLRSTRGR